MKFVIERSFTLGSVIGPSRNNYLQSKSVLTEVRPFNNFASDATELLAKFLKTSVRQISKPV